MGKTIDFRGRTLYPLVRISDHYVTAHTRRYAKSLLREGTYAEMSPEEFRRVVSEECRGSYNIDSRFTE